MDVLDRFSPATAEWFRGNFAAPTAAQAGAWESISTGRHALVVAPTGSGKTLAAFLWALDRLANGGLAAAGSGGAPVAGGSRFFEPGTRSAQGVLGGQPEPSPRAGLDAAAAKARRGRSGAGGAGSCRVLYVSPLKALAVDVERNLRAPLVGIGHAAARLGLPRPEISVAVRSGDTPAEERRSFARTPPDILITTPESLFLILTSAARQALRGVETVILDEVHAVAGTKRGAHLALSLERLDALLGRPAQRIGLSATVRPTTEVARFLGGGRPVDIVAPPSQKKWQLDVVVPVPDLAAIGEVTGDLSGRASGGPERTSVWPHVEERILELITQHRSTLVFANSRRLAERLTARLNELWWERTTGEAPEGVGGGGYERVYRPNRDRLQGEAHAGVGDRASERAYRPPAEVLGQAGVAKGAPASLGPDAEHPEPGTGQKLPAAIARAHHGSVSREQRQQIEEELKSGRLPAVVATSSLELGIDMGAVDLVVQVESPPSVASGLQRVGRAGHQVGAVSRGVLFPKFRGDLVQTAVAVERMCAGEIEALRVPACPLDVLAQQIVAMVAMDDWAVDGLESLVRRSAPFATLTRPVLESVLDMLSGRYPSDDFAELRPRLVWDRTTGTLSGRRGAQRLAVTSGGTIPDRGLYGVFIAGEGAGRRVGELDEEMVYESRVGDIFALGTSSWRVEEITHDRVLVTPAPGAPARLPFWKGDSLGRPAELGRALGAFVREVSGLAPEAAKQRVAAAGLDEWATENLVGYLTEQAEATGALPTDRRIVVERFRDELGDWQVVVHSPFGSAVHAPWALVAAARLRAHFGVDVQAMHADDGMVFRIPDAEWSPGAAGSPGVPGSPEPSGGAGHPVRTPESRRRDQLARGGAHPPDAELLDLLLPDPDDITAAVTEQLGGSALFASRFRECAGRALLLPKRRPDRRQALWQQRLRAAQLLEVASDYPSFPIVLEAVRECVNDVFDVPALSAILQGIRSREIATVTVETLRASPFAASLLFGYVAQFMYEGDSPLAERRAAALALDPSLLADLLGTTEGLALADLLDPEELTRTELELQHLAVGRRARDPDELTDVLRSVGPLSLAGAIARCEPTTRSGSVPRHEGVASPPGPLGDVPLGVGEGEPALADATDVGKPRPVPAWLEQLAAQRRVFRLQIGGAEHWAGVEDAGRLRDALGAALPMGIPGAFLEPVADPLGDLVARYARTHVPFTIVEVANSLGLGTGIVRDALRRLVASGRLVEGELRPPGWEPPSAAGCPAAEAQPGAFASGDAIRPPVSSGPPGSTQFCDSRVLQLIRRRSVAALRQSVEPVSTTDFARFLPSWQGVGELRGIDGVLRTVEQLAGVPLPASAVETLILPARVVDYRSSMLDELMAGGEVLWQGRGATSGSDGWVSLYPADTADLLLTAPDCTDFSDLARQIGEVLGSGGGYFLRQLAGQVEVNDDLAVTAAIWELVWAGLVTNDTFAPLRALLGAGTTTHRSRSPANPRARYGRGSARPSMPGRPMPRAGGPPTAVGRWSALPQSDPDPTARALATAEALLDRYGVVTRGSVAAEDLPGGFASIYRVLAAAEDAGRVRRGYFVERLGAAQFAAAGAVDRLRSCARLPRELGAQWEDAGPRQAVCGSAADVGLAGDERAGDRGLAGGDWRDSGRPAGGIERRDGGGLAGAGERPDDDELRERGRAGGAAGLWAGRPAVGDGGWGGGTAGLREAGRFAPDGVVSAQALVLAACDPANPYGAAVPWPPRNPPLEAAAGGATGPPPAQPSSAKLPPAKPAAARPNAGRGHQPARKAGALVVLVDGELVLYVERGGRTLLSWSDDPALLNPAAIGLATAVHSGALGKLSVGKVDGETVFSSRHPLAQALEKAGFRLTPRGLLLRR